MGIFFSDGKTGTDTHKERWDSTLLYDERLLYIPSGAEPGGSGSEPVFLKDIADDTYVMVPDRAHSFLSKSETGERSIEVFELIQLAQIYDKPPQYFLAPE